MAPATVDDISAAQPESRPARIFVGLKVAPEIACQLLRFTADLDNHAARSVPVADVHLTLVPPWAETSVASAIEKLRPVVETFDSFSLTFLRVSYGPDARRPRLLWAECMAADELSSLRAALLSVFGQSDDRPFRPHVTLARLRGNGRAVARRHPIDCELTLVQRINSVELFQSPPPGEVGYRVLASFMLRNALPMSSGLTSRNSDQKRAPC